MDCPAGHGSDEQQRETQEKQEPQSQTIYAELENRINEPKLINSMETDDNKDISQPNVKRAHSSTDTKYEHGRF